MEIQKTIKSVLLQTVALSIVLIVIGIVVLSCSGDDKPVMNAISIYGSYFGGITTLVAAYIASKLFNDWKKQEKTTFIRNIAYDTSGMIVKLFNLMQGYTLIEEQNLTTEIVTLHSQILIKLAILNRQINDNKMNLVNDNFQGFMQEYFQLTKLHVNNPQALKNEVSRLIKSISAEIGYLSGLANIDNVFEKLS